MPQLANLTNLDFTFLARPPPSRLLPHLLPSRATTHSPSLRHLFHPLTCSISVVISSLCKHKYSIPTDTMSFGFGGGGTGFGQTNQSSGFGTGSGFGATNTSTGRSLSLAHCFCSSVLLFHGLCGWVLGSPRLSSSPHLSALFFWASGWQKLSTLLGGCSWRWTTRDRDATRKVNDLFHTGPLCSCPRNLLRPPSALSDTTTRECDARVALKISFLTRNPTSSFRLWKYWWRERLWQHVQWLRHRH